ncbi:hypothetical protein [Neolewinella agarilytica]|uniref:hypothetical protein n=1 Tax=Neolewinella agarilytica TaxID=478744 RepID=UPI0023571947|nr:hypothetical protein [Neolewinella agarilytica]
MSGQHYSQLYRQLREVDPKDYQRIIRMYEEREREIGLLDVVEHFELTVSYVDALFETGAYRQHLLMVEPVIAASITHNFREAPGVEGEVFQHLLFKKAVSCFRLRQYPEAIHISQELIRIDPDRELYPRFLRASLFKAQSGVLQLGRGAFIFCILLAAAIITFDLLFVHAFYPTYVSLMQSLTVIVFLTGLLLLAGAYLWAWYRANRRAAGFRSKEGNK